MKNRHDAPKGPSDIALARNSGIEIDLTRPLVVAIGASAGGLEPLERFFEATDEKLTCSFIVMQHLSPNFRSVMDELLARRTDMPIRRISDGLKLEPGTIYLNVPRLTVTLEDKTFRLTPSAKPADRYRPIDLLFGSVAEQYGKNAIGVVLSGTGSDGTEGAAKLKQFGSQVIVQSPESARFESMPQSIVNARIEDGSGDPYELAALVGRWASGESLTQPALAPVEGDPIGSIIALIRHSISVDFDRYKPATVQRRIERRASQHDKGDLNAYYARISADPDELDALYKDILIEVTSFFRDPKAFDAVERHVMPGLVDKLRNGDDVRIWVPGCASGEEAYSLAMLLIEHAEEADVVPVKVRILATDALTRSLANANAGRFPRESIHHLSSERVRRFFEIHGNHVQIKPEVRKLILFSTHDVIRDAPFTQIDLLSCRNLLVYLTNETQAQVISKFHFSLHKGGALFLGPSESTVTIADEFDVLDDRWRLYKKRRNVALSTIEARVRSGARPERTTLVPRMPQRRAVNGTHINLADGSRHLLPDARTLRLKRAYKMALEKMVGAYAPPGFLLTHAGDVVHVFGDAGTFMPVNSGAFSDNLTELIRHDLKASVLSALQSAQDPGFERFERRLHVGEEYSPETYDLTLTPIDVLQTGENEQFLLITIRKMDDVDTNPVLALAPDVASVSVQTSPAEVANLMQRIHSLEAGLGASEAKLQTTIEELETSNDELQTANQELTAANNKLQDTDDELHSVNKELITINAENKRQIHELAEANADISKLLKMPDVGTGHVDMRLKRFFDFLETIPAGEARYTHVRRKSQDGKITIAGGFTRAIAGGGGHVDTNHGTDPDLSDDPAFAHTLELLVNIGTDASLSSQDKLKRLLEIGTAFFQADYGVLYQHVDDDLLVIASVVAHGARDLSAGTRSPLQGSFSSSIPDGRHIVHFHDAETEPTENTTVLAASRCNSYIGAAIMREGHRYGTVGFASRHRHNSPFEASQQALMMLIVNWTAVLVDD